MLNMLNYDIYWINNSENKIRYNHIKSLLETNFSNHQCYHIEAIIHKTKFNGITISHMVAIMKGMTIGKPFLVLEDDNILNNSYFNEEELEKKIEGKNIDAIYLGLSYWGDMNIKKKKILKDCMKLDEKIIIINNKIFMKNGARGKDYDEYFFKISNMFGAHAILYLSIPYIIETLKYCILAVNENKPHDIYLPNLHRDYIVLGQKYPWFYQFGKIGGQEHATNINFSEIRKIESENLKE
jgi:hypothetical protein